ncbi:hypothetical protein [Nocardia sp. CA-120079]|uniref:hypothetical protein n=1 Tax=Nocardia sp. CA-120079 TaxID=3239974 RepID=UPI003D982166
MKNVTVDIRELSQRNGDPTARQYDPHDRRTAPTTKGSTLHTTELAVPQRHPRSAWETR